MRKAHNGFTLIELLIVIVIILLIAAILLPIFSEAKKTAYQVTCTNNLRQIGIALRLYSEDWSGYYPLFSHYNNANPQCWWTLWGAMIQPYVGKGPQHVGWNYLVCPTRPSKEYGVYTYGVNYPYIMGYPASAGYGQKGSAKLNKVPSEVFVIADAREYVVYHPQWWWFGTDRDGDGVLDTFNDPSMQNYNAFGGGVHRQGANCLFADGRVRYIRTIDWVTNKNGIWGVANYTIYR